MIELTMLGTSCMVPTKDRNASSIYVEIGGKGILLDCGEGTQRQMNIANISRMKVRYIFISHWHADHTAGLLGLIQTIGFGVQNTELDVFGPIGTKDLFRNLMNASIFDNKMNIKVHEFNCPNLKKILDISLFKVEAINLDHGINCLGFRITERIKNKLKIKELTKLGIPEGPLFAKIQNGEDVVFKNKKIISKDYIIASKGKVLSYVADTVFTSNAIELCNESDLIISESTYAKKDEEKALEYNHMTSEQAGQIASMSNSKRLLLTHISQRYKNFEEVLSDAKDVFTDSELAYDFMKIKLK